MAQIQKGTSFVTGNIVTAANLNSHVDGAVLLPGAITDQTAKAVPLGADTVLVYSAADTALRKSTLTEIAANVTAANATKLVTPRNIELTGAVTGTAAFDGSANIAIATTLAATTVPAGSVFNFAAVTAPAGYLECNGTAISRTAYSALFAVTSTAFGVGDGATTFNLPDLRGEFVRGWDNARGVDSGRAFGSAQAEMVGPHTHPLQVEGSDRDAGAAGPLVGTNTLQDIGIQTLHANSLALTNSGTQNRPRNVALIYCIKT